MNNNLTAPLYSNYRIYKRQPGFQNHGNWFRNRARTRYRIRALNIKVVSGARFTYLAGYVLGS